ncbi:acylphosphatase [Candidatus Woesearchaeota archaeon]|nr:acylphosphatase [Candidatus Woesearchaeota archaeon]
MRKVHIYIDGTVLAVGFRTFLKRHADRLGINGYVRNIEGGVEVVAEGEDGAIELFIELCHEGPTEATVSNVTVEDEIPNFLFKEFAIRP